MARQGFESAGRRLQRWTAHLEPVVFFGSALLVVGFVTFGAAFSETAAHAFEVVQRSIVEYFGWAYIFAATGFLSFVVVLLLSPYGRVRLGGDDARPEFGRASWLAMLFSAGMGTGLVFWGVAEPLTHLAQPPPGPSQGSSAAVLALRTTFFHWGLHPWAIYAAFGSALAYLHFRCGLPLAPRSLLHPLIGERIHGGVGHAVDIVATVGTLFGVATSLGLGAMQINSGLQDAASLPLSVATQVTIIAVVTAVATVSVVLGIHRGVQRLSQLNMVLAALLLLFVFLAGPTLYVMESLVRTTGDYLQHLVGLSFWIDPSPDRDWQADWTLFYWSWWISWCPFVGVFTARISRGRTLRDYLASMLLVPTAATFTWLSVFGATGLRLQERQGGSLRSQALEEPALALHNLLGQLPWGAMTSVFATLLVVVFFVTSSDSGSLVDDMVTSGGDPNPPRAQRVFWAVAEGTVAATLLLTGGLQALRTAALTSGLPMMLLLAAACLGLLRALRRHESTSGYTRAP